MRVSTSFFGTSSISKWPSSFATASNAPTTNSISVFDVFHNVLRSIVKSWYFSNFAHSFSSHSTATEHYNSCFTNFLIYHYGIRSADVNDLVRLYLKIQRNVCFSIFCKLTEAWSYQFPEWCFPYLLHMFQRTNCAILSCLSLYSLYAIFWHSLLLLLL